MGEGKTFGEFELSFTSINTPYVNTVQHILKFELIFEYSIDGHTWVHAGSCINELYLTWKEPLYKLYENKDVSKKHTFMQMKAEFNNDKENILESILWIGCRQAKGLGNSAANPADNSEQIVDAIFNEFIPLKIIRRRETEKGYLKNNFSAEGLGYWRNKSSATSRFVRGLRTLLREGEARCDEFSSFFVHLALTQGIEVDQFVFTSAVGAGLIPTEIPDRFVNSIFLVKTWSIHDPNVPTENPPNGNKAQGNAQPRHFFWDHVFATFEKGGSKKYYDPSYGIRGDAYYSDHVKLLKAYSSQALTGVIFSKYTRSGEPFIDLMHSGTCIDIQTKDPLCTPFLYKTTTTEMEKYLPVFLFKTVEKKFYFSDENKTIYL